jgi:hypothetical protein
MGGRITVLKEQSLKRRLVNGGSEAPSTQTSIPAETIPPTILVEKNRPFPAND